MTSKLWLRTIKGFCYSIKGSTASGVDDPCYLVELQREDGAVHIVTASELLNALKMYEEWLYNKPTAWLEPFIESNKEPDEVQQGVEETTQA